MASDRKRKTKAPCAGCGLHSVRCICARIPNLNLKTKVTVIFHHRELKRTTNTGMLAVKALGNSEFRVRGKDREKLDLSDLLDPKYRTVLFYPSEEAVDLTPEFVLADPRPIQLLVPDGNWRQASKVHTRHPEISGLSRVMIQKPNSEKFHLRAEHSEEGMATLQAIAEALHIIEGSEVYEELMGLYRAKLHATLEGRPAQSCPLPVASETNAPPQKIVHRRLSIDLEST